MTKKNEFSALESENIENSKNTSDTGELFASQNESDAISLHLDENDGNKVTLLNSKKKATKEKNVEIKHYKKHTFLLQLRTLGILTLLGIFTGSGLGVWYFNTNLRSNVDYDKLVVADYIHDQQLSYSKLGITTEEEKENFVAIASREGKTPADFSFIDNFTFAQDKVSFADTYSIIGIGEVVAMGVKQTVYSAKEFDGQIYSFESISAGMVKVAGRDVLEKGGNSVAMYKGKNPTSTSATWQYDTTISLDDYRSQVGTTPKDVQPYIVSEKTILNPNNVTCVYDEATGYYTYSVELHPIYSVINYVKQMKKTAGLGSYPEFSKIEQTFVIDSEWNLVQIKVSEKYSAIAMGLKAQCSGNLTTDFKFNESVEESV